MCMREHECVCMYVFVPTVSYVCVPHAHWRTFCNLYMLHACFFLHVYMRVLTEMTKFLLFQKSQMCFWTGMWSCVSGCWCLRARVHDCVRVCISVLWVHTRSKTVIFKSREKAQIKSFEKVCMKNITDAVLAVQARHFWWARNTKQRRRHAVAV